MIKFHIHLIRIKNELSWARIRSPPITLSANKLISIIVDVSHWPLRVKIAAYIFLNLKVIGDRYSG